MSEKPMKLILLLFGLCAGPLAAQAPSTGDAQQSGTRSWSGSVGLSLNTLPYGLGRTASVSTSRRALALRLGYDGAANLKETLTLNAVSLSVGRQAQAGRLHLAAFAGPAVVWGQDGLDENGFALGDERYVTAGAALDVSALLALGSRLRLGVGVWANANAQQSTVGAGPRLQVRLR